jgi:hypothetical protein
VRSVVLGAVGDLAGGGGAVGDVVLVLTVVQGADGWLSTAPTCSMFRPGSSGGDVDLALP